MKYLASAFFACLLTATPATPWSVEVLEAHPSGQKLLITVLKDGAPQQGATLAVLANDGKQKLTLTTDSRGTARLPHLPPGIYCLTASTSPTLRADVCLQLAPAHQQSPSAFTMALVVKPPPPPTFAERLAAAESAPASASIRRFSGTVVDPSGSAIPRVSIAICRQGAGVSAHPRKIRSDSNGRFSRTLSPGRYTAVFSVQGFEIQFLSFEIARGAGEQDLRVKLKLGAVS